MKCKQCGGFVEVVCLCSYPGSIVYKCIVCGRTKTVTANINEFEFDFEG